MDRVSHAPGSGGLRRKGPLPVGASTYLASSCKESCISDWLSLFTIEPEGMSHLASNGSLVSGLALDGEGNTVRGLGLDLEVG